MQLTRVIKTQEDKVLAACGFVVFIYKCTTGANIIGLMAQSVARLLNNRSLLCAKGPRFKPGLNHLFLHP